MTMRRSTSPRPHVRSELARSELGSELARSALARSLRRGRQAGFTMVELTVALLAGLIVATGIVALSREATTTFHEEARTAVAEAALRAAMDRLRDDLQRAGYMSTGNIWSDTSVATAPGGLHVDATAPLGIQRLAALYLNDGGSLANLSSATPPLSSLQAALPGGPGTLTPDVIEIAGNMTSADQFDVAYVAQTASGTCINIYLSPTSPAMYRVLGNGDAGASELLALFQPDPAGQAQFVVRLLDDSGRSQYLATCRNGTIAGISGGLPYVSVDAATGGQTPLRTAQNTGTVGALSGYAAGRAWINPVQIVRWEITTSSSSADAEPAQFINGLASQSDGGQDATKYDLMRSYVDASGNLVATTSEIVSEYVVDLSIAFSVDTGTPLQPNIVTYAFDDPNAADNDAIAARVSSTSTTAKPQRIRSVRARLVNRTALADRAAAIPVNPTNYGNEHFMYRYCILASCPNPPANALAWARTRTLTTEVALSNQSRNFY